MWQRLRGLWSTICGLDVRRAEPRASIVAFPFGDLKDDDPIPAVLEALQDHCSEVIIYGVTAGASHVSDVLGAKEKRLMVIAHPSDGLVGFSLGGEPEPRAIRVEWWRGVAGAYDLMMAHVCRGGEILRKPGWSTVFPRWVSYDDDLRIFLGTARSRQMWALVLCEISSELQRATSPEAMAEKVRDAYRQGLIRIREGFSRPGGDVLTAMYFKEAFDLVSHSEVRT